MFPKHVKRRITITLGNFDKFAKLLIRQVVTGTRIKTNGRRKVIRNHLYLKDKFSNVITVQVTPRGKLMREKRGIVYPLTGRVKRLVNVTYQNNAGHNFSKITGQRALSIAAIIDKADLNLQSFAKVIRNKGIGTVSSSWNVRFVTTINPDPLVCKHGTGQTVSITDTGSISSQNLSYLGSTVYNGFACRNRIYSLGRIGKNASHKDDYQEQINDGQCTTNYTLF